MHRDQWESSVETVNDNGFVLLESRKYIIRSAVLLDTGMIRICHETYQEATKQYTYINPLDPQWDRIVQLASDQMIARTEAQKGVMRAQ